VREALLGGPHLQKVARLAIPGYATASSGQQAAIIEGLRTRLQVEATRRRRNQPADLYTITYADQDRQTAHRVVDQAAQALSRQRNRQQPGGLRAGATILTQQIAEYR